MGFGVWPFSWEVVDVVGSVEAAGRFDVVGRFDIVRRAVVAGRG